MALFGNKTEKKVKKEKAAPAVRANTSSASQTTSDVTHVLRHARITEKATMHQGAGVYTFDISDRATKRDIVAAVKVLYKVTPRKVAVVTIKPKLRRNMRTGKSGMSRGGRKAYVYLKAEETITIS